MEQLEIGQNIEIIYNDDTGHAKIKENGETRIIKREVYDYRKFDPDTDSAWNEIPEYFQPSAKMKSAYHLCRFCGGRGCLGCQKERERDNKRSEDK